MQRIVSTRIPLPNTFVSCPYPPNPLVINFIFIGKVAIADASHEAVMRIGNEYQDGIARCIIRRTSQKVNVILVEN